MKKKKKIEQEEPEKWDFRDKMIDGYSPYPSLGAYEYVRSLENIENETEEHHFNEKLDFMKKNEEIYLKEEGFRQEKCIAELESPVSSKFVSVRINGERYEYFNLNKTTIWEIVDILLLKRTSEQVLEELKENVKRLEKKQDTDLPEFDEIQNAVLRKINNENVPNTHEERAKLFQDETPFFGNNDNFAQAITEAGIKAAKATHEFNMKEIKAKLIADLCTELVKMPIRHEDVPQRAREIADKALGNL